MLLRKCHSLPRARALAGGWLCLSLPVLLIACQPQILPRDYIADISSAKPDIAIQAMNKAAEKNDQRALLPLVKRLYDEDPATRFCANQALMDITGEDMDFRNYEPLHKRSEAIHRWWSWLRQQGLIKEEDLPQNWDTAKISSQ